MSFIFKDIPASFVSGFPPRVPQPQSPGHSSLGFRSACQEMHSLEASNGQFLVIGSRFSRTPVTELPSHTRFERSGYPTSLLQAERRPFNIQV
jgi:hypothetical protein